MRRKEILISVACLVLAMPVAFTEEKQIYFVGNEDNGLYRTLLQNNYVLHSYESVSDLMEDVPDASVVILTAAGYPESRLDISAEEYTALKAGNMKLYIEYPAAIPGLRLSGDIYHGRLERGVVTSGIFGRELEKMSIVGLNDCHIIDDAEVSDPLMVYAKVAGFDKADYGLAGTVTRPLLFEYNGDIIATTALSNFLRGRYGPAESWRIIWERILSGLFDDNVESLAVFPADPVPTFGKDHEVTSDDRLQAVRRGADWLWNAHLFIHPSWEKEKLAEYQPKNGNPNLYFGPPIDGSYPEGDGSRGVMEGHASNIHFDGTQEYRYFVRADVQGETAFLLASAAKCLDDEKYSATAEKLLDYLFYTSVFRAEGRDSVSNPAYGLIGWANTHPEDFFNDDNARCILGVIGASALMDNQRWNRKITENILANFRTCSRQGFQGGSLRQADIEENGWEYYDSRDFVNPHPHFESWMWACYLWLYDKTGYRPLLEKARSGIRITMESYPDKWHTQNGLQQERARMVLPLAWLVRVEDTREHREWLDRIISELLKCQAECGAIEEELGTKETDKNKILVLSNDDYGKNEAPLISRNGDPVSDMLYTCNFLFFGLNEAVHATGDERYAEALTELADFLVKIQVRSQAHPDIDGAWFRAFDFGRWDYWASNADNGWGAWCTLTGWIQTWIVSTEAMVYRGTSFWDETSSMDMDGSFDECKWMLGNIH